MMLDGLAAQEVISLFPEGGLDRHRVAEGYPGIRLPVWFRTSLRLHHASLIVLR